MTRSVEDLDELRDRCAVTDDELSTRLAQTMNRGMYLLSLVVGGTPRPDHRPAPGQCRGDCQVRRTSGDSGSSPRSASCSAPEWSGGGVPAPVLTVCGAVSGAGRLRHGDAVVPDLPVGRRSGTPPIASCSPGACRKQWRAGTRPAAQFWRSAAKLSASGGPLCTAIQRDLCLRGGKPVAIRADRQRVMNSSLAEQCAVRFHLDKTAPRTSFAGVERGEC